MVFGEREGVRVGCKAYFGDRIAVVFLRCIDGFASLRVGFCCGGVSVVLDCYLF